MGRRPGGHRGLLHRALQRLRTLKETSDRHAEQHGNGGVEKPAGCLAGWRCWRERRLAQALADYVDLLSRDETVDTAASMRGTRMLGRSALEIETLQEMDALTDASTCDGVDHSSEPRLERLSATHPGEIGSGGMVACFLPWMSGWGARSRSKTLQQVLESPRIAGTFMREARRWLSLAIRNIVTSTTSASHTRHPIS